MILSLQHDQPFIILVKPGFGISMYTNVILKINLLEIYIVLIIDTTVIFFFFLCRKAYDKAKNVHKKHQAEVTVLGYIENHCSKIYDVEKLGKNSHVMQSPNLFILRCIYR